MTPRPCAAARLREVRRVAAQLVTALLHRHVAQAYEVGKLLLGARFIEIGAEQLQGLSRLPPIA